MTIRATLATLPDFATTTSSPGRTRPEAGEAVTLTLDAEIDVSRGDVLADPKARPTVADQFAARLVWMAEEALLPGRSYLFKCGSKTVAGSVTTIRHKIDVNSFAKLAADTLALNEVARVEIALSEPIAFDPYAENRETGAFVVIDRLSNATVAAGMIEHGLRRASNVHWQALEVTRSYREGLLGQKAKIVWFTGLSGSGKSTIANLVEKKLAAFDRHTFLLDGDNVRHGLNRDLGFTDADRVENIRRVGEVAKLMTDAGLIVLVSFISPFRAERDLVRAMVEPGDFVEVHVDTPLAVCEARDVKGLYAKARAGEIPNFTGLSSPYEAPEKPEVHIDTTEITPEQAADRIVAAVFGETDDWSI